MVDSDKLVHSFSLSAADKIELIDDEIKCNYLKCNAGTGLAGRGRCFNHGDFTDENCKQFTDEETWLEEWRKWEAKDDSSCSK